MNLRIMSLAYILINCLLLTGQSYKSIFTTDTSLWTVHQCIPDGGSTEVYFSYSDTIINELTYHIIHKSNGTSPTNPFGYDSYIVGFVREDILLGKYWFLKIVDNEPIEALFMDLGLNKGDTMAIIQDFRFMLVDSIIVDTVFEENQRRIVSLDRKHGCYEDNNIHFIEGIGASNGFYMAEWYEDPYPFMLICKYDNDKHVYSSNMNYEDNCFFDGFSSIDYQNNDKLISIFPNPSCSNININISGTLILPINLNVFDFFGRTLINGKLFYSNICLNFANNGIYYICFYSKDYYSTKKIIINGY